MKKLLFCSLLVFAVSSKVADGASCTLQFSLSNYSAVYQQFGYHFIPFSSLDPQSNGGGQFFVTLNGESLVSSPLSWRGQTSIVVSESKTCSSLYRRGLTGVEVAYADVVGKRATKSAGAYCLAAGIIPESNSQLITVPAFGQSPTAWLPC